jgi:selenide,water dikinase
MFPQADFPDVLRGLSAPDDAAVLKVDDNLALVVTADFFAPIVDDPFDFGAIAAANALSDVYAMGARPVLAINLAGFPKELDTAILSEILRGGAEKVLEAGAVIAGGHTTCDDEPKYGLAVVGMVHPDKIYTNGGAKPGDQLLFTKPIGTGVIATALKRGQAPQDQVDGAVASMTRLSAKPIEILRAHTQNSVHAVSDVTGFSLAGHGHEMADLSGVALKLRLADLPFLPGALEHAAAGVTSGGMDRNRDYYSQWVKTSANADETRAKLIYDPQTSGGLLISIASDALKNTLSAFKAANEPVWHIGEAIGGPAGGLIFE